ncbi:HD domain-containing phosphohydrolase [Deinococcus arboris]|nr:HD domain-containing phosphohydrolase [Deinococcus arboris]
MPRLLARQSWLTRYQPGELALGAAYVAAYLLLDRASKPFEAYDGISLWYLPYGLLLAVWLLYGLKSVPFVWLGIVLVDALSGYPVNLLINLLSVVGFALTIGPLARLLGLDPRLPRLADVLNLAVLALGVAFVYGLVTVYALVLAGILAPEAVRAILPVWWVGDLVGALVLTPFVLVWLAPLKRQDLSLRELPARLAGPLRVRGAELLAQALSLPLTVWLVFAVAPLHDWHLFYLCFLPVVWIALRCGLPGATLAVVVNSALIAGAVWLTGDRVESLVQLQVLVAALSLTGLILGQQQSAQQQMRAQRETLFQALNAAHVEIIGRLTAALDWRDGHTGDHTFRMASLCGAIARQLGTDAATCERIGLAALLHDLGKIGIPDAILHKAGPLSPDEWAVMRRHPLIGGELLRESPAPVVQLAEQVALTHHERWDGTGYPQGLRAEEIPLAGRIAAVADVYDALTSDRPYRLAWSQDRALSELQRGSGTQFDPAVVRALLAVLQQPLPVPVALRSDLEPLLAFAPRGTPAD